jgi:hypothetical protein
MRNTLANSTNFGTTHPNSNTGHFNQSIQDAKVITYTDGFHYTPQNQNMSLISSIDRNPIFSQTDKPLNFPN